MPKSDSNAGKRGDAEMLKDTVGKKTSTTKVELADLKEAMFNGEAGKKSDLDVLEAMARDMNGLIQQVSKNKELVSKAGGEKELVKQLQILRERNDDRISAIVASKDFEKKVEKQSWGSWALEKVKSVVLFPVRHPWITAAIAVAALAGLGFYYYGLGEAIMKVIPNYAPRAAKVVREGMKYMSDSLSKAGKVINSGRIPGPTIPGGGSPSVPNVPGVFAAPNAVPPVAPVPPVGGAVPPLPSIPTVPPPVNIPPPNFPLPPGGGAGTGGF